MVGDTDGGTEGTYGPQSVVLRAAQPAPGTEATAPAGAVDAADPRDAVRALRLALHAARLTLPDLHSGGRPRGCVTTGPSLIDLGSVPPDVALELAELISEGALHTAVRATAPRTRGEPV